MSPTANGVLGWLLVWGVAMVAIFGIRPRRNRRVNHYKPRPDTRDTLRFWRNSWRS